jgi:hypothetical protein
MRKNYQQVRKQKELARKVRQQEKQHRRAARLTPEAATSGVEPAEGGPVADADPMRGTS